MIGERLEEARKRKGVSIREAAEATKIRGDFLLAMEDNSFDIALPQIYVRGFLKNYASYLKLDPNKILTDYDAHLLGKSSHPVEEARSAHETLGRIEIKEESARKPETRPEPEQVVVTEAPEDDGPEPELRFSLDRDKGAAPAAASTRGSVYEESAEDEETWNENKALYMKIGIVFAGILLVSIVLIVLIQLLGGGKETPALNPEIAEPAATESAETQTSPGAITSGTLLVRASDNVTLIIEQTIDRQRLYSGSLNAGETISLEKEGPVSIRFTNGSALVIETNGRQVRPSQAGVGRTVVE